MDIFFLFWYVELVPKVCLHVSAIPCMSRYLSLYLYTKDTNYEAPHYLFFFFCHSILLRFK
jgi:hypothetical protein